MIPSPNVHFTDGQSSLLRHDVIFQHKTLHWGIDEDGALVVEGETNGRQYSSPLLHVMCVYLGMLTVPLPTC
jgi:hypothetical protein